MPSDWEPIKEPSPWEGRPQPSAEIVSADRQLSNAISDLKNGKPGDRSESDRQFAVVITEIEKARAILRSFLM